MATPPAETLAALPPAWDTQRHVREVLPGRWPADAGPVREGRVGAGGPAPRHAGVAQGPGRLASRGPDGGARRHFRRTAAATRRPGPGTPRRTPAAAHH